MQMTTCKEEDRLSFNPFLRHILCLLDAKQVLRCMRVSKQFYNIIKNNWREMKKIALNLEIKHGTRYNDSYRDWEYTCTSAENVIEVTSSQSASNDFVRYSFTIGRFFVGARSRGRCLPVLDIFQQRTPPKACSTEQPFRGEKWLEGRFDVSGFSEGLSTVLDMLMRCDVNELILNTRDITDDQLQTILRCVNSSGPKLLSTAKVFGCSGTILEILRQLEANIIHIEPDIILDCKTARKLPTHIDQLEIVINGTLFNSLKPIAILIEEWQQGRRDIHQLELINKKFARPYPFSVSSIAEMLSRFEMMTIIDTTVMDLRGFLARESDTKMLFIEYNPDNLRLQDTTV